MIPIALNHITDVDTADNRRQSVFCTLSLILTILDKQQSQTVITLSERGPEVI
jgi:hypothetical protein